MHSSSIIVFGVVSAMLLILSCISFDAPTLYNELAMDSSSYVALKPTIVLRDRSMHLLEHSN